MCDSPYYVKIHWQPEDVPVPCGRCPPCQQRRVSQWAFRLRKEEEIATSAHFVTLTYDTSNVPISKAGYMTLCKKDYQKFMKRLRKIYQDEKITKRLSYYACGEYGSNNYRPHYHAIIFNAEEERIAQAWQLGTVHIGKVTGASIAYTLKYINKGKLIPMHRNDDRVPEFSLMSKKMGLNYLSPAVIKFHKNDLRRAYIVTEDGFKIALPRYYKDKIYDEHEQRAQALLIKTMVEESDSRARRKYTSVNGSEIGYDEQVESGRRQRYARHRRHGKENRKL